MQISSKGNKAEKEHEHNSNDTILLTVFHTFILYIQLTLYTTFNICFITPTKTVGTTIKWLILSQHNYMQKVYYSVPNKPRSKIKLKPTLFLRKLYACYAGFRKQLKTHDAILRWPR